MSPETARTLVLEALVSIKAIEATKSAQLLADSETDLDLVELGIDSVAIFDFCLQLEKGIGREIDIMELVDNGTLNKLARHLSRSV